MAYRGFLRLCGALFVGVVLITVIAAVGAAPSPAPFSVYIPTVWRRAEPFTAYTGLITSDRDGDDDVYLINADGQNLRARTINSLDDNNPQWSPDATLILFEEESDTDDALYIEETNGENLRVLAALPGDDFNPSWSPDGRQVAFINRDESFVYGLYVVPIAEGAVPRRIASNVSNYDWSPRENALLFTTLHQEAGQFVTDLFALTDTTVGTPTLLAANIQNYAWSPQGDWVVLTAPRDGDDEVYVTALDGVSGYQITDNTVDDAFVGWAEGGASVLITRDVPEGRQLYVVSINGENEEPVALDPGDHYVAGIREDGREVVYGRVDESAQYLYIQSVRGGAAVLIADPMCAAMCGVINVSWSSDYQRLAYQTFRQPTSGQFDYDIYVATLNMATPRYDLFSQHSDTPVWLSGTHTLVYYRDLSPRDPPIPYSYDFDSGTSHALGAVGERVRFFEWRVLSPTTER